VDLFSSETTWTGPRVTALRARERLNLHRRLKITMIRRRSERRALLNATYIPFAIGGRGSMINNAGPIRYTPWYKRNTCANREAEKRDEEHDRGWRKNARRGKKDGGGREPDVSNEYLIANPRHFQRISRLSAERMRAPLDTVWPPALSREPMPRFSYPRVLSWSLLRTQKRETALRGESGRQNKYFYFRSAIACSLPPNFMSRPRGLVSGEISRRISACTGKLSFYSVNIPLNLLLPNLHAWRPLMSSYAKKCYAE